MKVWLYLACCLLVVGRLYGDDDDDESDSEPKRLVVYYNFEKILSKTTFTTIKDKSGYENSGVLQNGGEILKYSDDDYTCSQGARLYSSNITIRGDTFQAKPRNAITVAAWIRLEQIKGQHSIFHTVGSSHTKGQYHFEVNNGVLRWFHRDENARVVFETMAHTVAKGKWVHVAGTYDSKTGQAKAYINGEIRNNSIGSGMLSRDWSVQAGISNLIQNRPLQGSVDEFRIYNYALTHDEIRALVSACKKPEAEAVTKPLLAAEDKPEARSETPSAPKDDGLSNDHKKKKRSLVNRIIRKLNFT